MLIPYFRLSRTGFPLILPVLLVLLLSVPVQSENSPFAPEPPVIQAPSAILWDLTGSTLLYEKEADREIPPASMTKLMSLHLAFRAVEEGRLALDQLIPVSRAASFKSSPPHSSLMFLEEGQKVTLLDLMIGLALPSGNDAGIALAEAVSGGLVPFVEQMNLEARRLGLEKTRFVDSFGYSENNMTTPREFAEFCRVYIEEHPLALKELHSLRQYTYPREENMVPPGVSTYGPITQYNHNNLIGRLDGVDGLKTGFIDESGYNLAVTAERNGRRLLAVLMGGPEILNSDGNLVRALDAASLLTYGFTAFTDLRPEPPVLPEIRIWKGRKKTLPLSAGEIPLLTLDRVRAAELRWEILLDRNLTAPVAKGTPAGTLSCLDSRGNLLFSTPLVTREEAPRGPWWRRLADSLRRFFLRG